MYTTYPVRTSKEIYTIPIIRRHECNMGCYVSIYEDETTGQFQFQPNPNFIDGRCEFSETLEWSLALITDQNNWRDIERLTEVVIVESSFTITLNFPLYNPRTVTVHSQGGGFTREDILTIIRMIYIETYAMENSTATQNIIEVTVPCTHCTTLTAESAIESVTLEEEQTCCVCIDKMAEDCYKLPCDHVYHRDCIGRWIATGKTSCPMCRTEIINCQHCNGTKTITNTYSAAVPERASVPFGGRLLTDGNYGIHNYYLEDLALQGLVYNRAERKLKIDVCPLYR